MSFTLAIENGDIAPYGSRFKLIQGSSKLEQMMTIWLFEKYRSDRFHPSYGSILDDYIGSIITDETQFRIQEEIRRVLSNLQKEQKRMMRENPNKFDTNEILYDVTDIDIRQKYDSISVSIEYRTLSGLSGELIKEFSV